MSPVYFSFSRAIYIQQCVLLWGKGPEYSRFLLCWLSYPRPGLPDFLQRFFLSSYFGATGCGQNILFFDHNPKASIQEGFFFFFPVGIPNNGLLSSPSPSFPPENICWSPTMRWAQCWVDDVEIAMKKSTVLFWNAGFIRETNVIIICLAVR